MPKQTYDVVIIGAGHNGLTCAAYLGMAGLSVKVVERRPVVGGAAVTEEFHPGFRNSVAAYTVSLLNPKVIRDLCLHEHGLTIVERRAQNFLPRLDGQYLIAAEGRIESEVAKFSAADAKRLDAFNRQLDACADVLRELVLQAPPNLTPGWTIKSVAEFIKAGALGRRLQQLPTERLRQVYDLFTKSAADYLDGWFEGELVKALFGFDAVVGNYASPYAPGSAYVLLHHAFGEVNGKQRVWGHAIGGMGAITQAMAKAAASHGVEIETSAPVREVLIERDRVGGVVLADGRIIRSNAVAANVNPKLLYTSLVSSDALDPDYLHRMQHWRCGSGTFRMNVALSRLPNFSALPGSEAADHHTAGIIMAPSLDYMDRAYADARRHGWSREPIVGRQLLGPASRDGGRSDDRQRRSLCAGFQGQRARPPGTEPARPRPDIRSHRRRHFPWRAVARSIVLGPTDARLCRLSQPAQGPLSLRRRRAPRRGRHRRTRPQRRPRDPGRSALAIPPPLSPWSE